ncbi:unnamed protein product [Rodentolepis nana]|uniref:Uncharacterized protein n=1 Tax=Rodentolepis nana TaxID=102285 RepID=A0A0R3TIN0_RODNA|nr:unnamed protein product [Rodentolepis nana]
MVENANAIERNAFFHANCYFYCRTKHSVMGAVTAIALRGEGHQFFVATDKCQIYRFDGSTFNFELINSCHSSPINDIEFPENCSDLFVTCSYEDIRVFHTPSQQELLRINIPNRVCFCIDLVNDGTAIVSGIICCVLPRDCNNSIL